MDMDGDYKYGTPAKVNGPIELGYLNLLAWKAEQDGFATAQLSWDDLQRTVWMLAMRAAHGFVEVFGTTESLPDAAGDADEQRGYALASLFRDGAAGRYRDADRICTISPSGEIFDAGRFAHDLKIGLTEATAPTVPLKGYALERLAADVEDIIGDRVFEQAVADPDGKKEYEKYLGFNRAEASYTYYPLVDGEEPRLPKATVRSSHLGHRLGGLDERTLAMRYIESPTLTAEAVADDLLRDEGYMRDQTLSINRWLAHEDALAEAAADPDVSSRAARAREIKEGLESLRLNVRSKVWVTVPGRGEGLRFQLECSDLKTALYNDEIEPYNVVSPADRKVVEAERRAGGKIAPGEISAVTYGRKTVWEGEPLGGAQTAPEAPETAIAVPEPAMTAPTPEKTMDQEL